MCLSPIYAYLRPVFDSDHKFLSNKIEFLDRFEIENFKINFADVYSDNKFLTLPCRKCLECQIENSRMWTLRCLLESKLWKNNIFITLTYENSPISLCSRDVTLFIKRLRKHFVGQKIRYFGCGEYGSRGKRPHYHLILFNCKFDDLKFLRFTSKKSKIYTSKTLEKLWGKGFVSIGSVDKTSIRYCTKYIQKMNIIPDSFVCDETGEFIEIKKPYIFMSLKPGIGLNWFKNNYSGGDFIFVDGEKYSIPDYFKNFISDEDFMRIRSKNHYLRFLRYLEPEKIEERRNFLIDKLKKFSS